MVNQLTGRRFAATDLGAGRVPVLFVADWCGYCGRFLPHFKRLLPHAFVVDISDESDPLWDDLDIKVVPTVILFDGGAPAKRWAGVLGAADAEAVRAAADPAA